jgi:hypothetical protein
VGSGKDLRVLIVGDSAAAGVGASTQTEALSGQVVSRLANDHRVLWKLWARSGLDSRALLDLLEQHPPHPFDVVLLSIGVNDVTSTLSVDQWITLQQQLIDVLRDKFAATQIVMSPLPPMHPFPALPQPLRWYLGNRAALFNTRPAGLATGNDHCTMLTTRLAPVAGSMARDGFHPARRSTVCGRTMPSRPLPGAVEKPHQARFEQQQKQELKMSGLKLQADAAASLDQWHAMIRSGDLSALPGLLDPNAIFRSPMAHTPYPGAPVVSMDSQHGVQRLSDFAYHRELATADGLNVVLEFSARVGEKQLKGIDLIRFNEQGKLSSSRSWFVRSVACRPWARKWGGVWVLTWPPVKSDLSAISHRSCLTLPPPSTSLIDQGSP